MRGGIVVVVALLSLVVLSEANDFNLKRIWNVYGGGRAQRMRDAAMANTLGVETLFFDQRLDHFSPQSSTFKQRFYVNDQFYNATEGGPVFFYVGGEAALSAGSVSNGFIATLARDFHALVVGLEHRFYGVSHPFAQLTTANLKYLSSQQALSDAALFRAFITEEYQTGSSEWVSIGGSYPGSLSAWLRLKFPHLFAASLASSAPVHAKADFFEYDQVVRASAGEECASRLHSATLEVEKALQSPDSRQSIKKAFKSEAIDDDVEFLYVIADMAAFAIQYKDSVGDKLCAPINAASSTAEVMTAYQTYVAWLLDDYLHTEAETFNIAAFTSTAWTEDTNMRQWMYQSCVEFGYFQTAPAHDSVRSTRIDLAWHYDVCDKLFGAKLIPNVDWTNDYYGSNHTAGTNIFFTNGSKDPWHFLSVQQSISATEKAEVIDGTAHCADLHAPSPADPQSLTLARSHVAESLKDWLSIPPSP